MANVCVITGGGSGMGLETARNIDKDVILVLTGRTVSKLENAKAQLEAEGHQIYEEAEYMEDAFIRHMVGEANLAGDDYNRSGMAYVLSKNFVVWYAQKCAHEYAGKGIRVVSVSPGLIETDMGSKEVEQSDFAKQMIERSCEHRMGKAEELGFAIATIADARNGYLSGIDVLIDGGASTGKKS